MPHSSGMKPLCRDAVDIVRDVLAAWAARDLDLTLSFLAEHVTHDLNVDGVAVPFAASRSTKTLLRSKYQLLIDTFDFNAFVVDHLQATDQGVRANILIFYTHKRTGERLDVRFRMTFEVEYGLVVRINEYHDAAYIEAFARLVGDARPKE